MAIIAEGADIRRKPRSFANALRTTRFTAPKKNLKKKLAMRGMIDKTNLDRQY